MNSSRCFVGCLCILALALLASPAFGQVSISIDIAPPPLVVDVQPACPDDGYLWTPGYWAYDPDAGEYYWVPGAWVQPPEVGLYWTPPYWGWQGNAYVFYDGYWGPSVGFYGGVNYGHGYWGRGYGGGRWDNGHFAYNTAANNVKGGRIHNTYADRSMVQSGSNRVSFNGGKGGTAAQPTAQEQQVAQQRVPATPQQQAHFQAAAQTRSHPVKVNAHANPGTPGAQTAAQPQPTPQVSPKPAAVQPVVHKQDAQFTGGDTQAPKPVQTPDKQATPAKTEMAPTFDKNLQQVERTPAPSPQPAPETHQTQVQPQAVHQDKPQAPVQPVHQDKPSAPPEAKHEDKPQPQHQDAAPAQPQAPAPPQPQGQGNPGGQGKQDDHQGNGH